MSNGFLQLITKATGIQGISISLIDHITTNSLSSKNDVGTIVNDISDHFFCSYPSLKCKKNPILQTKELCPGLTKNVLKNAECLNNLS